MLPVFKIRASAASEILAGSIGLTDVQSAKLYELSTRKKDHEAKVPGAKPLTEKMEAELMNLLYKFNNPELPEGAKNYCQKWLKEQLYNRRKHFTNRYLEKGIQCEDGAIEFASEYHGWIGATKNDEWFEDDYMQGTPDIILNADSHVIDIKNSYDAFSFPLFDTEIPTKGYDTQLQVYLALTGHETATLAYVLMDAPLDIMKEEMRRLSWKEGSMGLVTDELYQKVKAEMTYSNLIPELRLKTFTVVKNNDVIDELRIRVELCREYIAGLLAERKELLKQTELSHATN
jgi:hypothetical protein